MKIKKIQNKQAEEFLKNNFSSPTHWPDWNLLVEKHYDTRFYYFGAFNNGILKGICPIHKTRHRKFLRRKQSGQFHLIPNGGWIFSEPHVLRNKYFPTPWNSFFQTFSLPNVKEFNVRNKKHFGQIKKTLIIDLEKSSDEIWKQDVDSKRRNMIRKAEKENISIKQAKTEKDLRLFYDLYTLASKRFSTQQLSFSFFLEMFFNSPNIHLDIYTAFKEKKPLSNIGIVSDKNYSFYWLGNNVKSAKNAGQGEMLQWHAIKKMKEKGCKYYDLCYIEPEKLPAIYNFKKGFSKKEQNIILINKKSFPFKVLNKAI
jgi:hypothetical protein